MFVTFRRDVTATFLSVTYTYAHHGVRMRIMPRARYWKTSMNDHVILKGVDVEVIKVIQLASEVHN